MITLVLLILAAAVFNAVMDASSENEFNRSWWNKDYSWKNKWKTDESGFLIPLIKSPWYYLGFYEPKYPERFPFSSTLLVFLTDGWHLSQFFFHSCWQMAIAIQFDYWYLWFVGIKVVFSSVFTLVYSKLNKK